MENELNIKDATLVTIQDSRLRIVLVRLSDLYKMVATLNCRTFSAWHEHNFYTVLNYKLNQYKGYIRSWWTHWTDKRNACQMIITWLNHHCEIRSVSLLRLVSLKKKDLGSDFNEDGFLKIVLHRCVTENFVAWTSSLEEPYLLSAFLL